MRGGCALRAKGLTSNDPYQNASILTRQTHHATSPSNTAAMADSTPTTLAPFVDAIAPLAVLELYADAADPVAVLAPVAFVPVPVGAGPGATNADEEDADQRLLSILFHVALFAVVPSSVWSKVA